MIWKTKECKGITLPDGTEVKTSGFADDTGLYIKDPEAMKHFKAAIDLYCKASAAKLNWNKCVGVTLGAEQRNTDRWDGMPGLEWMQDNQAERYLGACLGSTETVISKWDALTDKINTRAQSWSKHHISFLARVIVSKASLASCMWYMS